MRLSLTVVENTALVEFDGIQEVVVANRKHSGVQCEQSPTTDDHIRDSEKLLRSVGGGLGGQSDGDRHGSGGIPAGRAAPEHGFHRGATSPQEKEIGRQTTAATFTLTPDEVAYFLHETLRAYSRPELAPLF